MKQLIDKDALVAEMEKTINELRKICNPNPLGNMQERLAAVEIEALCLIKNLLDTIETKEVDLEKELNEWRHNHFHGRRDDKGANGEYLTRVSQLEIAEHFFELGLKATED